MNKHPTPTKYGEYHVQPDGTLKDVSKADAAPVAKPEPSPKLAKKSASESATARRK
jgi:hypothetical protein